MKSGRPPTWNPFRDEAPGSWTELAVLAARGRLTIPASVRRCVDWLVPLPRDGLLATIGVEGRVELLPWLDAGKAIIDTRIQLLKTLKDPLRGDLAVALADKHFRISIEEPGRIGLPPGLHSFLNGGHGRPVRFVATHQQLWLWDEERWQLERVLRDRLMPDT